MAEKYVFGIDLGTTYSCISYVDYTGHAVVIQNLEGQNTTPSVVQIDEAGNPVVGQIAKENAVIEQDSTIEFVKRNMGEEGYKYEIHGTEYTPEEISAFILMKLAEDVKNSTLGVDVKDVVITCPAYFGVAERMATENAGKIAGLNVMEIIKEPLAAAIHFGATASDEAKNYMVFDLGGGTFDVTIMHIENGTITEICSDGDHKLGGKDWDDAIINYVKQEIAEESGIDVDFAPDEDQKLRANAEEAKKRLTARQETPIRVTAGGETHQIILSRETFNDITESLLDRTFDITEQAIEVAREKGVEVDEILLVGGSTKMPQVKEAIVAKYGIEPKSHEPDEAVAKGAAIHAVNVYLNNQKTINDWDGTDTSPEAQPQVENPEAYEEELTVSPLLIGQGAKPIETVTATTKSYGVITAKQSGEQQIVNLIVKNNPMPGGSVSVTKRFGTLEDNQVSVLLQICESDELEEVIPVDEDYEIGNAKLTIPPGLPAGAPIEVTLTLDNQGLLKVYGKDLTGNNEVHAELHVAGALSEADVEALKQKTQAVTMREY